MFDNLYLKTDILRGRGCGEGCECHTVRRAAASVNETLFMSMGEELRAGSRLEPTAHVKVKGGMCLSWRDALPSVCFSQEL